MPDRAEMSRHFLAKAGWGDAARAFLAGDASDRSYDRLTRATGTAVLMDAPPGKGDDPASFIRIAEHLHSLGLSAPRIVAKDLTAGFLLLEDLGDGIFARLVAADPESEPLLYTAATDVLLHLHRHPAPQGLDDLRPQDWADAAAFALDWYRFAITGDHVDKTAFVATLTEVLQSHANGARVMILRDYHAENLLWLPERNGVGRVGLLDFQLAQMGQRGYDLVSLLQDARRDVQQATEAAMIRHFLDNTGESAADFSNSYAVLGAQRALRIIGIFARLCLVAGKQSYLGLIPRVWGQLQRNLAQPALRPLAKLCAEVLPPPTPENLSIIGAKCGHFR